jgi:predicted nucleic acid-binding protein
VRSKKAGPAGVTVQAIRGATWLSIVDDPLIPPGIQAWGLGEGESSVLAWATAHQGVEAIIDDLAARRCAAALGVPVRGTLGLVLVAKRRGNIPFCEDVARSIKNLWNVPFRPSDEQGARLVGE